MTVTASILNVLDLDQVFEWWKKHFSKSVFGDDIEIYVHQAFGIYGLENMPEQMIQQLQSIDNYCQPWIQDLKMLGKYKDNLQLATQELKANDLRRGLDLTKIFPAVAKFINYQH